IPPDLRRPSDVKELLDRYPAIAQLLPSGSHLSLTGKELLKEHPEALTIVRDKVESEIASLPSMEALRARPDLARLLPDVQYKGMSGQELLTQHPEVRQSITEKLESEIEKLQSEEDKWGMIAVLGLHRWVEGLDDRYRSPFLPY